MIFYTVSLSITELEYIAASEGAKDARWIRQLLAELYSATIQQAIIQQAPCLYTDNEAALKLTRNNAYHRRTRHLEHKWHYIRQEVSRGDLIVKESRERMRLQTH